MLATELNLTSMVEAERMVQAAIGDRSGVDAGKVASKTPHRIDLRVTQYAKTPGSEGGKAAN